MGDFFKAANRVFVSSLLVALAACGGGGGGDDSGGAGGTTTTVSGKITFDRVPIDDNGLNFNGVTQAPARQIVVEAIRSSGSAILTSTTTDTAGNYTLTVPTDTSMFIRAKAQMSQSGSGATWNFSVKNNAGSNALYVLDGTAFDSGTSASTRDLNAPSGWNVGSGSYTSTRAAAPFAILDTVYQAKELVLSAQASEVFPALDLYWSSSNRSSGDFCPTSGRIGTTSFVSDGTGQRDDCTPSQQVLSGIYVLGSVDGNDTDEFDQHVIAHEFGHYVENSFARSDSIGGNHGSGDHLDPRVAFGEGWGNAFAAMALNDSVYKDTFMSNLPSTFDLEDNSVDSQVDGWFSEMSVGQTLWDVFDSGTESGDAVALGFAPIFAAFTGPHKDTDALTTIYSFMDALESQNPSLSAEIEALETGESIRGRGAFVEQTPETNNGGDADVLPLYTPIALGDQTSFCTDAQFGKGNKLNNRRFLRLTLSSSALVTIFVSAIAPTDDPDLVLWHRGEQIATAVVNDGSTDSIDQVRLGAGDYVIEVYDFAYANPDATNSSPIRHCMTLNVSGT